MEKLLMPKLGMAQSYCIIEKWLKKPGDKVKKGDIVVEVSTDKVAYEVESKSDGYILKILKAEKEEVPVHEVIAYIGQPDEAEMVSDKDNQSNSLANKTIGVPENTDSSREREILISPLAKKIIADNGLDINMITGKGPGGRIMKEDVQEFMESNLGVEKDHFSPDKMKSAGNGPEILKIVKLEGIRKIIAQKMLYSKQNIPHISQSMDIDVTAMMQFKENLKETSKEKITVSDLLIKAVALALKVNPEMNSAFIEGEHIVYRDINIGLVTSVDQGLIIPVIKFCDKLSLQDISIKRNELVKKARGGNIEIENISGGTFTITNLGMLNIRSCTAIIYPPQAAILSVGGIFLSVEAVSEEKTAIRKIMNVTVTEDHRVLDGIAGARFLSSLKEILEEPGTL